jgi:hypothetical protein
VVIYEVSAEVAPRLVPAYEQYMRDRHIPDVLGSGCFQGASLVKSGETRYRIAYVADDEATLRRYLAEHAPELRADFARHFPEGVELSRDVWRVLQRWP